MKNKKWFSLIEVIIATSIISITIFGIYKLISENTKSVEKSNMILTTTNLFSVLENCIENNYGSWYLYLWTDLKSCNFQNSQIENNIDWIYYIISSKEKASNSKITIWETKIFSEFLWTKTWTYVQRK